MYCVHGVPVVKHAQITKLVQLRLTGDPIDVDSIWIQIFCANTTSFLERAGMRECGI